ncbi:Ig-like domain repeat protein [Nocardioides sp. BP30]|uniref:Ig-like domain repeat protein n=1 Tax=Nocardioides sp. BP30 TaxID=3036374 RepID=UPI00246945E0|nr:Ig-like domain repeat protein [Nocardioides sp. BP30]WGL51767.1 Ig-like domain repeat protein [Nocardioides sp. BP30]
MNAARLRGERGHLRDRLLVLTTSLTLGVVAALTLTTGQAAATTAGGLTYSCSYDVLGSNVPTPVVLDSDLPAVSGVRNPLNITTSMTLTMPASVAAKMEALPGFRTAQLSPDGASDGVSETYIAPTGRTPVTAHPVLSELAQDGDGDVPFSGMSPAPYAMNPGPSVPGTYSLVVGALSFQLHVDATTPVTYQVSCQPPSVDVLVDTFRITAPTSTAVTVTGTWTYGDTPPGATATVTRTGSTSSWPAVSGSVQFYADGDPAGAAVPVTGSGAADLAHLPALEPGDHQISAAYSPDAASPYLASTSTASPVTIDIGTSIVVVLAPSAAVEIGDAASATATLTASDGSTVPGQVTFTVAGTTGDPVPLTDGSATIPLPTTSKGRYTVTASYPASGLYRASTGNTTTLDVGVAATTTRLELDRSSASYGEPVTASVIVSSAHQPPAGSVTISVGEHATTVPLTGGQAQLTLPTLPADDYQIHAVFTPTDLEAFGTSDDTAALTVLPDVTTTALVLDAAATPYGERITATATVTGGPATALGTVTFTVGGRSVSATVVGGRARVVLPVLRPGSYQVLATFVPAAGSNVGRSTSAPARLTVRRDATSIRQRVSTSRHRTRLVCVVNVVAAHGTPVTGRVRVTLRQPGRGHRSTSVLLERGGRTVRFRGLARHGSWSVVATYAGSVTLAPSTDRVRRGST